jgi:NADPH-dependent glutamate synthase beta subunit-like oxidoreductase
MNRDGTVRADPETGETSIKGLFAGGDVVTGPGWAIDAIAAGKKGAESIHRYLT